MEILHKQMAAARNGERTEALKRANGISKEINRTAELSFKETSEKFIYVIKET